MYDQNVRARRGDSESVEARQKPCERVSPPPPPTWSTEGGESLSSNTVCIHLPLPPKECWPNRQRVHWRIRYKAQQEAKEWAFLAGMEAGQKTWSVPGYAPWWTRCTVSITFRWPDRRRRDLDNAVGACKPYLDSLKDLGIYSDDSAIVRLEVSAVVDRKAPGVTLTIEEATDG